MNYYGFNHEAVNKKFTGGLTFLNEFCVNNERAPVAVYKVTNPDRSKGHKDYLLLQISSSDGSGVVRGMDEKEMKKWRYQDGVKCLGCKHIVLSTYRHNNQPCACKTDQLFVDGGRDYLKVSAVAGAFEVIKYNLLTNKIVVPRNEWFQKKLKGVLK